MFKRPKCWFQPEENPKKLTNLDSFGLFKTIQSRPAAIETTQKQSGKAENKSEMTGLVPSFTSLYTGFLSIDGILYTTKRLRRGQ